MSVYGWYTWFRCLSSACDVLEMSVVRGVGGVCDLCIVWLGAGRGGRCWGEWVTGLGLGFTNSGGTWGSGICVSVTVVWVVLGESGWVAWARVCEGGVVLYLCVL